MKAPGLRVRLLLAAWLPLLLCCGALAAFYIQSRYADLDQAHQQRIRAVARQVALASEFGLFAGNDSQLQSLLRGVLREPDVRSAGVRDAHGQMRVFQGDALQPPPALVFNAFEAHYHDAQRDLDWLSQPVHSSEVKIDDLYEGAPPSSGVRSGQLGQIVLAYSRQGLQAQRVRMLTLSVAIGGLGLILGALLAWRLGQRVLHPIEVVSRLIEHIGHGDFDYACRHRSALDQNDPLYAVQASLCDTADRLAAYRDDLQAQINAATQMLREKKEEAELANQAKSRFLAAASHDLRQPTHALGLFVSRLAQVPHDGQTAELVAHLQASVSALQTLLDRLLDISRLEARAVQVLRQPLPLQSLFDRLAQDMGEKSRHLGLRMRLRPTGLWVDSDPSLLYRIVLNLVSNALRYTERGGVLVTARRIHAGSEVHLQVWDTGIGIAPQYQKAVFQEFFQVANAARERSRGLGLGLNIVQRTAALLEHPLTLRSQLGRGSVFGVILPAAAPQERQNTEPAAFPEDALDGRSVLLIEDDPMASQAMQSLLQSWGLQVEAAHDAASAHDCLNRGIRPDLILSDVRLPGPIQGLALVAELRARLQTNTAACLMSGDTDPDLIRQAQAVELTLLHKPVRPAKLRALLRRLLA
ncbi:MAG: hypothetical protein OHK0048_16320 [Rhodoferax sp.]